jgi:hypothetical protein
MLSDPLTLRAMAANTAHAYRLTSFGPGSRTVRTATTSEDASILKDTLTISHDTVRGRTRSLIRFDFELLCSDSINTATFAAYLVIDRPDGGNSTVVNPESLMNARLKSLFDGDTSETFGTVLAETQKFFDGEP